MTSGSGHLTTLHVPTSGLGYRQRAILTALTGAGRPVPTGYLVRVSGANPKTVHVALLGLSKRGLATHVAWGRWAA